MQCSSEDGMDWQYNLNAIPRAYCGMYKIHRGFASTLGPKFWVQQIMASGIGTAKVKGICGSKWHWDVVGHSLGGAKAALLCRNKHQSYPH